MYKQEINIYCDESCHLENEKCTTMVVACLRCPKDKVREISNGIISIKKATHRPAGTRLKRNFIFLMPEAG